jgi:hypothetical protein
VLEEKSALSTSWSICYRVVYILLCEFPLFISKMKRWQEDHEINIMVDDRAGANNTHEPIHTDLYVKKWAIYRGWFIWVLDVISGGMISESRWWISEVRSRDRSRWKSGISNLISIGTFRGERKWYNNIKWTSVRSHIITILNTPERRKSVLLYFRSTKKYQELQWDITKYNRVQWSN